MLDSDSKPGTPTSQRKLHPYTSRQESQNRGQRADVGCDLLTKSALSGLKEDVLPKGWREAECRRVYMRGESPIPGSSDQGDYITECAGSFCGF